MPSVRTVGAFIAFSAWSAGACGARPCPATDDGRETALGQIGEATLPAGYVGFVGEASLSRDGQLVTLRSRREAEVLDIHTIERRAYDAPNWIHTAWLDVSGTWLVIETLDAEPIDPAQTTQRPHVHTSHWDEWCAGLVPCSGPARTHALQPLEGTGPRVTLRLNRGELRPWGWVAELDDGSNVIGLLGGPTRTIPQGCVPVFAGLETPFVVLRCGEPGAELVVLEPGGGSPRPLVDARAEMRVIDRSLLSIEAVVESLGFEILPLEVSTTSMDPVTVRVGWRRLRWSHDEERWFHVDSLPCPTLVQAVGLDRRALVLRQGPAETCGTEQRRGASQLVWTERIVDGLCGERLVPQEAPGDQ